MQASDIPYKFAQPWGNAAGVGYLTDPIPTTASGGAASQSEGFPPITATPTGAGGIPPDIADFNGAFSYFSLWDRWQQAGGSVPYDATFQSDIGGYPAGARVRSASGLYDWLCLVDDNVTNPETGGAGWQALKTYLTISETTIVAAASQTILLPAAYERFRLTIQNGVVSTAANNIQIVLSSDGGGSFLTAANYTYIQNVADTSGGGTGTIVGNLVATAIPLSSLLPANNTGGPWDATFDLWPGTGSAAPRIYGNANGVDSAMNAIGGFFMGSWGGAPATMNALRLQTLAGTISLKAILEGLPA